MVTHNGLDPVDSAPVDPHKVSRLLDKPIDRNVILKQVLQVGPPGPCQIVDAIPTNTRRTWSNTWCHSYKHKDYVLES